MAEQPPDSPLAGRGLFDNLGTTLLLLRELRGRSQSWVARTARVGKSQLSKYETGKELPKLESLARVLKALEVGQFAFFYTLHLVDQRAARPAAAAPLLERPALLSGETDRAFSRVFEDLLALHRSVCEQILLRRNG